MAVKFIDFGKKYGQNQVIFGLNLTINEGEIACILGESGVGKTTILRSILGLTDYEGTIEGVPKKVATIFQTPRLIKNLTVEENLKFVLPKSEWGKIEPMLEEVGLLDKKDAYPSSLSGGQAQRVSICRAFLIESDLLLMDEPFSSLDTALKIRLIDLVGRLLKKHRQTVLFVTHDVEECAMLSSRALIFQGGKITYDFCRDLPLPRPYGENSDYKTSILKALLEENAPIV